MSFGSSPAAKQPTQQSVLQAAASPAAQPPIAPPPIPLPPPSANTPTLASVLQPSTAGSSLAKSIGVGAYDAEGRIATSPLGDQSAPHTGKVTLLGK